MCTNSRSRLLFAVVRFNRQQAPRCVAGSRQALGLLSIATLLVAPLMATAAPLRVCADPNNLPFSNRQQQGFENKIAQVIARDLHRTVTYTWMPQRRSFFRRTLLARDCDVVMGVPSNFDMVAPTRPYYRSTYAIVTARAKHLNITSFDDPKLKPLRIGIHAVGSDGANTPPAHALAKRGLVHNIVGYRMWAEGGVDSPPGRIVHDVANGKIDVAFVWGPFAGYFAKKYSGQLEIKPIAETTDVSPLPYTYDISLGVRKDDMAFKQELQQVLDRRRADIKRILNDYEVPLLEPSAITAAR